MGRGNTQWNMTKVRGDSIVWLRPDEESTNEEGTFHCLIEFQRGIENFGQIFPR
jgi:hypothetical protein